MNEEENEIQLNEQEEVEEEKEDEKNLDESHITFKSEKEPKENVTFGQKIIRTCYPGANATNIKNSFPLKYFSCCFNTPEKELEIVDNDSYSGNTYMCNENVDGVMSLFPSKYLRSDERKILKFDKPNIIQFMTELNKDVNFIRKFEKYEKFGVRMFMLDKNKFSSSIPVTKCEIEIPLNLFTRGVPSVEDVGLAIINPESRKEIDDHFKEYRILKQLNNDTETIQIITKKAMQMIIPREFYEKRTHFIENGIFYSYSSSAPDSIRPPKKEPIRAMNYFGVFKVENDGKNILIEGYHQIDIKIGQPGPLIFMSLPLKMMEFTEELIKFLNK